MVAAAIAAPESTIPAPDDKINMALQCYLRSKTPEALDGLMLVCLPYIRAVISKIPNPIRQVLDFEDLVQHGVIGFLGALERFDSSRGTPFKAYVYARVHGAAMDAIRKASPTSRTRNARFQTLDEIVENELTGDTSEYVSDALPAKVTDALRMGMSQLPIRQASVLLLLMNGLTVGRVATMFGISTSRVNQERQEGIAALRSVLLGAIPS